jgi:hypothetical protein
VDVEPGSLATVTTVTWGVVLAEPKHPSADPLDDFGALALADYFREFVDETAVVLEGSHVLLEKVETVPANSLITVLIG